MTATVPPLTAAELGLMGRAAGAFLARQEPRGDGRPAQPAAFGQPAGAGLDGGAGRGYWRWPGASGPRHEDVAAAEFFPAATGITPAELDVMRQAGAGFLTGLLGGLA